jgi:hypothetical protein
MHKERDRDILRRIEAMLEPRHLFILPVWADPAVLDRLIQKGYLTCLHCQRDDKDAIYLVMALQLTAKGNRLIHPLFDWPRLALRGSLAGASCAVLSLLILYWG